MYIVRLIMKFCDQIQLRKCMYKIWKVYILCICWTGIQHTGPSHFIFIFQNVLEFTLFYLHSFLALSWTKITGLSISFLKASLHRVRLLYVKTKQKILSELPRTEFFCGCFVNPLNCEAIIDCLSFSFSKKPCFSCLFHWRRNNLSFLHRM